jgi:predicted RNA binding protein YcfA (HicA-like mRNA interferase family)
MESFGFNIVSQRGSHVKMRRLSDDGSKQMIAIPMHSEIDTGTLKAIFRQALHYIPEDKLRKYFYTE